MDSGKRVLLAAPRGYCAGVDRAVITVEKALEVYGAPVYVRKEIVHNKHVVTTLEQKGVIFVNETDEVPEGRTVVFSAHGVSPAVHEQAAARSLKTIDATCPLVTKVHQEVRRFANDETEIPMLAKDRMVIVEKIVRRVEKEGISLENLLIDPLAMPVGADPENVKNTLETIYLIKEKYGLNMSIGASNVSFGLPNRHVLNAAFMPMAMSMGLTSAIMDGRTPEVVQAVRAADLLLGLDQWGANWISNFRANKEA